MRGLRIKEEDLPADGDEFGPFDARDHGDLPQYDEDAGDDDYGPLHDLGRVREALRSGEATDETGYDLPIRRREAVN
jgi:hypothetical protein